MANHLKKMPSGHLRKTCLTGHLTKTWCCPGSSPIPSVLPSLSTSASFFALCDLDVSGAGDTPVNGTYLSNGDFTWYMWLDSCTRYEIVGAVISGSHMWALNYIDECVGGNNVNYIYLNQRQFGSYYDPPTDTGWFCTGEGGTLPDAVGTCPAPIVTCISGTP